MWSHMPRAKGTKTEQNRRRRRKGKRERGIIRDGRRVPIAFMVKAYTHSCHDTYIKQARATTGVHFNSLFPLPPPPRPCQLFNVVISCP